MIPKKDGKSIKGRRPAWYPNSNQESKISGFGAKSRSPLRPSHPGMVVWEQWLQVCVNWNAWHPEGGAQGAHCGPTVVASATAWMQAPKPQTRPVSERRVTLRFLGILMEGKGRKASKGRWWNSLFLGSNYPKSEINMTIFFIPSGESMLYWLQLHKYMSYFF